MGEMGRAFLFENLPEPITESDFKKFEAKVGMQLLTLEEVVGLELLPRAGDLSTAAKDRDAVRKRI